MRRKEKTAKRKEEVEVEVTDWPLGCGAMWCQHHEQRNLELPALIGKHAEHVHLGTTTQIIVVETLAATAICRHFENVIISLLIVACFSCSLFAYFLGTNWCKIKNAQIVCLFCIISNAFYFTIYAV
jgi:hypothetical protein